MPSLIFDPDYTPEIAECTACAEQFYYDPERLHMVDDLDDARMFEDPPELCPPCRRRQHDGE